MLRAVAVQAASGSYTPTYTNVNNIAAKTTFDLDYIRVGSRCYVWGQVLIDPTAAAPTDTQLGISLPFASNLTAQTDLSGVSGCPSVASQSGGITADTTNDRANMQFSAVNAGNARHAFFFAYVIK